VDKLDIDRTGIVYTNNESYNSVNYGLSRTEKNQAIAIMAPSIAAEVKSYGITPEATTFPDAILASRQEQFLSGIAGPKFLNIINIENLANKINEIIKKINEIEEWKAKGRQATAERHAKAKAKANAKKPNAKGTRTKTKKPANSPS